MVLGREHQLPMDEAITLAYFDWMKTQGVKCKEGWVEKNWLMEDKSLYKYQAPGRTCLSALSMGGASLQNRLNHSKGCGGVMRTAPCGFVPPEWLAEHAPEDAAAYLGTEAAAITHSHDMGWVPAAMLSDMIRLIVDNGDLDLADVTKASLEHVRRLWPDAEEIDRFSQMIHSALEMAASGSQDDLICIRKLGEGWVGDEALAIAVYAAVRYQDDFDACLRAAVNHSGDSDSTGAIAGNIVGARLGAAAIDRRWIEPLDVKAAIELSAKKLFQALAL